MKIATRKQIGNANNTIGNDEGSLIMKITNKIEHQPSKKIKLARAVFGKKHIRLHHLLQWDQKYKKLGI